MHKSEVNVGKKIRRLREYHNLTQIQLSEALFVRQQNISKYEKGEVAIPIDVLIRIADFFHISTDYLLGVDTVIEEDDEEIDHYYRMMHPEDQNLLIQIARIIIDTRKK